MADSVPGGSRRNLHRSLSRKATQGTGIRAVESSSPQPPDEHAPPSSDYPDNRQCKVHLLHQFGFHSGRAKPVGSRLVLFAKRHQGVTMKLAISKWVSADMVCARCSAFSTIF